MLDCFVVWAVGAADVAAAVADAALVAADATVPAAEDAALEAAVVPAVLALAATDGVADTTGRTLLVAVAVMGVGAGGGMGVVFLAALPLRSAAQAWAAPGMAAQAGLFAAGLLGALFAWDWSPHVAGHHGAAARTDPHPAGLR